MSSEPTGVHDAVNRDRPERTAALGGGRKRRDGGKPTASSAHRRGLRVSATAQPPLAKFHYGRDTRTPPSALMLRAASDLLENAPLP